MVAEPQDANGTGAGLAAVGSGLFPVRLNILVSIGAFDLLSL